MKTPPRTTSVQYTERELRELRLFLEEICCNLCRFYHLQHDGYAPESVKINQEFALDVPNAFADIRVQVPDAPAYFIEVNYGYSRQRLLSSLQRKYGDHSRAIADAAKLILVIDAHRYEDWSDIEATIRSQLNPALTLEVWDERHLLDRLQDTFEVHLDTVSEANLLDLRAAIDRTKGIYAFGEAWCNDSLQSSLLWHFGFWKLRQLCEAHNFVSRDILPPGIYKNVVVLMADLCAYSSYVRDTRDDEVAQHSLTTYYSNARYEVLNTGGMMFQFVGDEVTGLFGLPQFTPSAFQDALACARALIDIGNSVSNKWQRQIDRVQPSRGVHIGIATGDVQIVSLRPYGRAHLGAVSDAINMAARLVDQARSGEIVVSNSYYQGLDEATQAQFEALDSIDAHNIGTINAWKLRLNPE